MADYFALLGFGARGFDYRDKNYPIPGGEISWIRWHDSRWDRGETRPVPTFVYGEELPPPPPPEGSEEWYEHAAAGRLLIRIDERGPWESTLERAQTVSDALLGLAAISTPLDLECPVVPLKYEWVDAGRVAIQDLEEPDYPRSLPEYWELGLDRSFEVSTEVGQAWLEHIGPVLADGDGRTYGLFPALLYYRLSALEFAFAPDDVRDIVHGPRWVPETPFHRARAEESFHNAWKAIEAALGGEPSKTDAKLRQRLAERGVDPGDDLGFPTPDRVEAATRIAKLHGLRDRQSAHGGRVGVRRGQLTYFDLVEAQWVAARLIQEIAAAGS